MNENQTQKLLKYALLGSLAILIFLLLIDLRFISNIFALAPQITNSSNLWTIFLTGLFVGGLTCMAVQGGLLAATIAQREEERLKEDAKNGAIFPIVAFIVAKLVAYTVIGFLLGLLGSAFQLSLSVRTILQFAVVIFMVGTALNILEVHPIFRYFVIQPPRFLTRLVRNQSKSKNIFAPALLGAFTVFIPCGTTQAMMALAIASGNPLTGASILFAFILGTSPLFFILGYMTTRLGDSLHQQFMRFAAFAIILLAIFNLNNALALTGINFNLGSIIFGNSSSVSGQPATNEPTVSLTQTGYSPNIITVKAGSQVTLHLTNTGGAGCIQAFTIPSLGIQKIVPMGNSDTVAFTAPNQPGQLAFMCSMGMYRGVINVI
ncbi:MAG TPA: sulfite exporter TauE/SafE family protein [Patescibacteria group bacterium]|nr:sulfite exporter TauE/SafE family protein [Patescibacteria group bacterium]